MFNEAAISISVFLNDKATYDSTMTRFLRSAAQYFYLKRYVLLSTHGVSSALLTTVILIATATARDLSSPQA